jgi:hypothetical protein
MSSGRVCNAARCGAIPGARLERLDGTGLSVETVHTDAKGRFQLPGEGPVRISAEGFTPKTLEAESAIEHVRLLENQLVGYLDRFWWEPGEDLPVYVHAPEPFSITLYRHGKEREEMAHFGSFDPLEQQVPDYPFVENGLDWKPATRVTIPPSARPGLYSLLLESGDEVFALALIVSTPKQQQGKNRLLVLASTNNWLSYNTYGGRSRYRNYEQEASRQYLPLNGLKNLVRRILPRTWYHALESRYATRPWMLHRLSIKRPFPYCGLDEADPRVPFANHLAGGEWRVIAWLEEQGLDYDMVAGYQLHRDPGMMEAYRAIILSTHCEYWSREMYQGVMAWHGEEGGWILNLSGNSIYREVEYYDDGSHRCSSLYFEDSCADESQLIGVRFSMVDYGTAAPYTVEDPRHWALAGLGVEAGTVFGTYTLNGHYTCDGDGWVHSRPGLKGGLRGEGASGWETDKLTETAAKDFHRIAKGLNPHGGADMVIREAAGTRGGVFSASSISFGGSLLPDPVCSGIVRNVLNRCLDSESPG